MTLRLQTSFNSSASASSSSQIAIPSLQSLPSDMASGASQPILPSAPSISGKPLQQADWYMKEEAHKVTEKLSLQLSKLTIPENSYIVFSLDALNKQWHIGSLYQHEKVGPPMALLPPEVATGLANSLSTDLSLTNDVIWLQSGFKLLAESVELLTFSKSYEQNREDANKQFKDIVEDALELSTAIIYYNGEFLWTVSGIRGHYYID